MMKIQPLTLTHASSQFATDENQEPASYLEIKENVTKAVCDAYPSIPNGTDSSPSLGAVYDPSDSANWTMFCLL